VRSIAPARWWSTPQGIVRLWTPQHTPNYPESSQNSKLSLGRRPPGFAVPFVKLLGGV
jgi:hypothetical protein